MNLRRFELVEAHRFTQGGFDFHIRKDVVYIFRKTQYWIITECSSGAKFAFRETLLEALLLMDVYLVGIPKKHHDKSILITKAKQFNFLLSEFNYHGL